MHTKKKIKKFSYTIRQFFGRNYRVLAQNKGNTFKKSAHLDTVGGRDTTR